MKWLTLILLLFAIPLVAQDQKGTSEVSNPGAKPSSCVILKRMGPADEVTSHLYSFGIRGKQFQYVEGDFPRGLKFHGRLTDNDVRNVLDKGGKVEIVEPKYTEVDVEAARKACLGLSGEVAAEAGKESPRQSEKAKETMAAVTTDHSSEPSATIGTISVSSNPNGADIYVDGDFIGSAPATLKLTAGKHSIKVTMEGFQDWSREIAAQAGSEAHLVANLSKPN
jgi:hypothetical protein